MNNPLGVMQGRLLPKYQERYQAHPVGYWQDEFAVAAEVADFDSGNSNRDAHSLEVLEALKFPMIKFYSEEIKVVDESLIMNGKLEFHGQEKEITISSSLNENEDFIQIQGVFQVIPTEFLIKLPSFMLAEIRDLLTIKFDLFFKK